MQRCAYGVYLGGHWQWFASYQEAAQAEADELRTTLTRCTKPHIFITDMVSLFAEDIVAHSQQ